MSGKGSSEHVEPRIGRALQLARKERGLSLRQVEQATKIRARYLEELERENFDVLPAVYVQGSLKTYANFLQLDGEALARELSRRRASRHRPQDPAYVEPPKGDYFDRSPIFLGGATGAESQEMTEDEGDAGAPSSPVGGNLIYLSSAALLALVAVALALILPRDSQPAAVSQVREPLISQAPSQASRVGGEENAPARPQQEDEEQSADGKSYNHLSEQHNGPSGADTEGDGGPVRTEQDPGGRFLAQGPRTATATQSASPSAQKEPAAAKPEAASTPPPAEAPAQITATGVPVKGSGRATPPPAQAPAQVTATTPPAAEAPAQVTATGVPVAGSGGGETGNISPGPRNGDRFDIQIRVGADDPVRITGNPVSN
jgi:cytoskeletal protein RodZ